MGHGIWFHSEIASNARDEDVRNRWIEPQYLLTTTQRQVAGSGTEFASLHVCAWWRIRFGLECMAAV